MAITATTRKIGSGSTEMDDFDSGNYTEGSFTVGADITGTELQPQFTNDETKTNWTDVGAAIPVSANGTYSIPDACFRARFSRLVSDAAEAAERTITLGLRR